MNKKEKKITLGAGAVALLAMLVLVAIAQGVFAADPKISEDEAKQIAEDETGGTAGDVTTEREDGVLVYEVQCDTDKGPAEVEIDADTGEVLEVEYGPDDD